jgi:hypothetical protein
MIGRWRPSPRLSWTIFGNWREKKEFDIFLNICEGYEFEGTKMTIMRRDPITALMSSRRWKRSTFPLQAQTRIALIPLAKRCRRSPMRKGSVLPRAIRSKAWKRREELVKNLRYPSWSSIPKAMAARACSKDSRADTLEQVLIQVEAQSARNLARRAWRNSSSARSTTCWWLTTRMTSARPFAYPPAELIFPQ